MHHLNELLDKLDGNKKEICSCKCEYYEKAFEHNERACVLSDVYSVKIGKSCSTFEIKKEKK